MHKLGYLAWHADSERRYKAGQRQRQCKCCGLWFWRHEMREHRAEQLKQHPNNETLKGTV